ncbi:DUF2459 domain-containing protein [Ameyamaea chiangmaiensis]|uniref:DUF2459 domain-containing protein n=1 Tax=Ameyamaea chiangmaiensis TaxID=442969 RepID=A0A850PHE7_9PROT|nr:DUF2459 domain-containing protein [Ameyamaea chiangmaiensis]MBS4076006.1 DUF2459 domain-containing protein [Ameyamaea chiangmaiensis]NVN42069.1 DUF2459 domain-containing protein [Ameyamaea chiangmaiensis]
MPDVAFVARGRYRAWPSELGTGIRTAPDLHATRLRPGGTGRTGTTRPLPVRAFWRPDAAERLCGLFALLMSIAGCSGPVPSPAVCTGPATTTVWVVDRGWHTELAVPATLLNGPAAYFRKVFPSARTILIGYGKKTFITAPADDLSAYLIGPFPGPAVIQVGALSVLPTDAYATGDIAPIALSDTQARALSEAINDDLAIGHDGRPRLVSKADSGVSLFYAARSGYRFEHTCNRWTVERLRAAGLPVDPVGVVLAGQAMRRLRDAPRCPAGG